MKSGQSHSPPGCGRVWAAHLARPPAGLTWARSLDNGFVMETSGWAGVGWHLPLTSPPLPPSIIKSGGASKVPVALLPWPDARLLQDALSASVITRLFVFMASATFKTVLVLLPVLVSIASPTEFGRLRQSSKDSTYVIFSS